MTMMTWNTLMSNWSVIVAIVVAIVVGGALIYKFFHLPTEAQMEKVREWMVWACIEAEHDLKSGTGQAKLRKVYSAFVAIPNFSWIARIITFETFSELLEKSLEKAKQMIIENDDLAKYVYGKTTYKTEVNKLKDQLDESENTETEVQE